MACRYLFAQERCICIRYTCVLPVATQWLGCEDKQAGNLNENRSVGHWMRDTSKLTLCECFNERLLWKRNEDGPPHIVLWGHGCFCGMRGGHIPISGPRISWYIFRTRTFFFGACFACHPYHSFCFAVSYTGGRNRKWQLYSLACTPDASQVYISCVLRVPFKENILASDSSVINYCHWHSHAVCCVCFAVIGHSHMSSSVFNWLGTTCTRLEVEPICWCLWIGEYQRFMMIFCGEGKFESLIFVWRHDQDKTSISCKSGGSCVCFYWFNTIKELWTWHGWRNVILSKKTM